MDHLYGEDTGDAEESEVEHTVELPDMTAQVAQTERKRGQRGLNRKYAFVSKHATLEEDTTEFADGKPQPLLCVVRLYCSVLDLLVVTI